MKTISIFGDSIAHGFNAPNQEGWAHLLKNFLKDKNKEANVLNFSKDGATSIEIQEEVEEFFKKEKAEEVILAFGLNDSAYSFSQHRPIVPREEFEKNVENIFSILEKNDVKKIVVIGISRVDERRSTFSDDQNNVFQYQNIVIQKYNDSLKGISSTKGSLFVSTYDLLSDDELDDGYHPSGEGHSKIFREISVIV